MKGKPMTAALPPPRQTGRADFPHPAFAERLFRSFCHSRGLFSSGNVALLQSKCSVVGYIASKPLDRSLSPSRSAKAPSLHGRYPASSLLWASPTPPPPTHALWIRHAPCPAPCGAGGGGLPACPTIPSLRAAPFHPGKLRRCSRTSLRGGLLASSFLRDWPLSLCLTRLIWVRLRRGSQVRSAELRRSDCSLRRPLLSMLDVQLA
jgi:hypothetical protein